MRVNRILENESNQDLRERESRINMQPEEDEFSNLQLYEREQFIKTPNQHKRHYYDSSEYDENDEMDDCCCCSCTCCHKCCLFLIPKHVWFVKDCCGIVCAVLTWMLVLFAEMVVMFVILIPATNTLYSFTNGVIFNALAFLALASHAAAMFSDPGTVELNNATVENIEKAAEYPGQIIYRCPKCLSIKPLRAHHCSVCNRCIRKMDHHCPWVNNCVGEANQKFFVLFTLYIFLISFHAAFMIIMHMIKCVNSDWAQCSSFSPPATVVFIILLGFESLLFGIFTGVMFGTQISAILSDETGIETLKREEPKWNKKSYSTSLKTVFGNEPGLKWLSPFAKPSYKFLSTSTTKLYDV